MFRLRGLIVFIVFMCFVLLGSHNVQAQTKPAPKKESTIIYKDEVKEDTPATPVYNPRSDMKETVIIIKRTDTTAPKYVPTYKDTVIILKKGLSKEKVAAMKKAAQAEEVRGINYCNCVKMDIKVASVLEYETYLSYDFIFKNDCKVDVWVSSKHFRFVPFHASGAPVKVLRKLSFVQRYGHPDFVKILPGESYTFSYSDDPFFEYDLKRGGSYRFSFEHRNFGDKARMAPEKTYFCGQKRTQLIDIK